MRFIGDVHGWINDLTDVINKDDNTVFVVGDIGFGFEGVNVPTYRNNVYLLRGNHDDPAEAKRHPNYAGDWGYNPHLKTFWYGGEKSIDKAYRLAIEMKGGRRTWWPDEEIGYQDGLKAIEAYGEAKPEIMVSHGAPESILDPLLVACKEVTPFLANVDRFHPSSTAMALQSMLSVHRPKVWVFGHFHVDWDVEIDGTRFICVNELSDITI